MDIGSLKTPINLTENGYCIQGKDLRSICESRETPFYLYDLDHVVESFKYIRAAFPWPKLKVHYAMKANHNMHILKTLASEGAFLDTISPAEFFVGCAAGFKKEKILYTANNMTNDEMRLMHSHEAQFNIDSLSALVRFGQLFPGSDVSVRFNPDVVAGESDKVSTGGNVSKFGVLLSDVDTVCRISEEYQLKIVGVHEHTGSGVGDLEKAFMSMKNLLAVSTRERFPHLRFVDFGGGLKVPYKPSDKRIDYQAFGDRVVDLFSGYCKKYGNNLNMHVEPGKYLVAEAGLFILQVNTLKNNLGHLIVGTDSGFAHFIRPVLYDAYHHIINISNPSGELKKYDVCGNTAESDRLAAGRELPEIREGDYLAFLNAGAYCFSMSSTYNLRPLPAEYLMQDGKISLSRPKLTHADLAAQIVAAYGGVSAVRPQTMPQSVPGRGRSPA